MSSNYLATQLDQLWQEQQAAQASDARQVRGVPIFVTGTGTDVGKTYVTALLCRQLQALEQARGGLVGFYKAAISGAENLASSDAGYIKRIANLQQADETLTSYLYREAVSPHLAARHLGQSIAMERVLSDLLRVYVASQQLVMEGSGGIFCPLQWELQLCSDKVRDGVDEGTASETAADLVARMVQYSKPEQHCTTILDLIRALHDSALGVRVVVVADAGLGAINDVVLTVQTLQLHQIKPQYISVILNRYQEDDAMYQDNLRMMVAMTHVPVIGTVAEGSEHLQLTVEAWERLGR